MTRNAQKMGNVVPLLMPQCLISNQGKLVYFLMIRAERGMLCLFFFNYLKGNLKVGFYNTKADEGQQF